MICPLCSKKIAGPPTWAVEVYHNSACGCGDYSIDYWDKEVQIETVELNLDMRTFKIVFDRLKNETKLLEYFVEYRGFGPDHEWTELIATMPPIKNIPGREELEAKIKIWMTFS